MPQLRVPRSFAGFFLALCGACFLILVLHQARPFFGYVQAGDAIANELALEAIAEGDIPRTRPPRGSKHYTPRGIRQRPGYLRVTRPNYTFAILSTGYPRKWTTSGPLVSALFYFCLVLVMLIFYCRSRVHAVSENHSGSHGSFPGEFPLPRQLLLVLSLLSVCDPIGQHYPSFGLLPLDETWGEGQLGDPCPFLDPGLLSSRLFGLFRLLGLQDFSLPRDDVRKRGE